MTLTHPPRQLRLIIETDDFDEAVRFYRDILGMPEQAAFATMGDDRVAILRGMEDSAFFQTVRGGLVTGLYNQKEV